MRTESDSILPSNCLGLVGAIKHVHAKTTTTTTTTKTKHENYPNLSWALMSYKGSERETAGRRGGGAYIALTPVPVNVLSALHIFINPHKHPVI